MPKISIIMPVFNKQQYLEKTLGSVLEQDFSDYELIVVDDGSTDKSPEILEDYRVKDERIKIIRIENRGVSHARNVGLENAKGEWIQFLDGDDQIEKEYLKKSQEVITKHESDIVFTSFRKIDETGNLLDIIEVPLEGIQNPKELQKSFLEYQFKTGFYGFPSNKLFRKSLLEVSGIRFDESIRLAEDLDFFVQICRVVEKAYYLPEISYNYLVTGSNYIKNPNINYLEQLNIQKRIRKWIVDAGVYETYKDTVDGQVCRYAAYMIFDAAARNKNIGSVCADLLKDETVNGCLNVDYVTNKVHKRIIDLLKKNKIHELENYLRMRERLKKLFGRK